MPNEVATSNLGWVEIESFGDHVDEAFTNERPLVAAGGAVGLVGQSDVTAHPVRRHPVRAGEQRCGQRWHGRAVRAHIRSLVLPELVVDRMDDTVETHSRLDDVDLVP